MGVDRLPRKADQPFYNVLVDDGSIRYAADENLVRGIHVTDGMCEWGRNNILRPLLQSIDI